MFGGVEETAIFPFFAGVAGAWVVAAEFVGAGATLADGFGRSIAGAETFGTFFNRLQIFHIDINRRSRN